MYWEPSWWQLFAIFVLCSLLRLCALLKRVITSLAYTESIFKSVYYFYLLTYFYASLLSQHLSQSHHSFPMLKLASVLPLRLFLLSLETLHSQHFTNNWCICIVCKWATLGQTTKRLHSLFMLLEIAAKSYRGLPSPIHIRRCVLTFQKVFFTNSSFQQRQPTESSLPYFNNSIASMAVQFLSYVYKLT